METAYPVTSVPVGLIDPSPFNPRKTFDENTLDELAASIREAGVVQPAIVRPHPQSEGRFELVAGERRWLASKRAEKDALPAIVRKLNDRQVWEIQIIENDQRVNLHPLEQARGFEFLMKSAPQIYTVEEIALRTGQEPRHVLWRLQLLKLIPDAQKLFAAERLPVQHASELSRLQPEQQEEGLEHCFGDFKNVDVILADPYRTVQIDVRQLRDWVKNYCLLQLKNAPFDIRDAELMPTAGPCTSCPKRTGNAPFLFADLAARANTCTDPVCFQQKKAALVQIRLDELKKQGLQPVRISDGFSFGSEVEEKDVIRRGHYRIVDKDSCEFTQPAIYSEGQEVGRQVYICAKADACSVHNGRTRYSTPEQKRQRSEELRKQKVERAFRQTVLEKVRSKLPKVPRKEDLQTAAAAQFRWMGHDNRRRVFRAYRWEERKSKGHMGGGYVDYEKLTEQRLEKMSASELLHFLVVCALAPDLGIPGYQPDEPLASDSRLAQTAVRYRIDLKALRQKVTATVASPKKAS
jgi:ParB family chromosome partitioning protein